jgi:hypothetical protein
MSNLSPAAPCFSSPRPAALGLPHLITALDAELIGQVSHLTRSHPGLWSVPAPFDGNDQFDNTRESAPLAWWALPLNQAEVQGLRWHVAEAVFGSKLMFVNSVADETVLAQLAVPLGRRLDTGAYVTDGYEDLPSLSALLDRIDWALIPLGPERSRALFITRATSGDWVEKLREWTDHQGRSTAMLRDEAGTLVLAGRPAPAKYRDNAMAQRIDGFLGDLETLFGEADPALVQALEQRLQVRRELRQRIESARQSAPPA